MKKIFEILAYDIDEKDKDAEVNKMKVYGYSVVSEKAIDHMNIAGDILKQVLRIEFKKYFY